MRIIKRSLMFVALSAASSATLAATYSGSDSDWGFSDCSPGSNMPIERYEVETGITVDWYQSHAEVRVEADCKRSRLSSLGPIPIQNYCGGGNGDYNSYFISSPTGSFQGSIGGSGNKARNIWIESGVASAPMGSSIVGSVSVGFGCQTSNSSVSLQHGFRLPPCLVDPTIICP